MLASIHIKKVTKNTIQQQQQQQLKNKDNMEQNSSFFFNMGFGGRQVYILLLIYKLTA